MTTETTTPIPPDLEPPAPRVRASTPEREEAVARLHHALGEGRLDLAETEARAAAAYAAQYRDELPPLLADLPAGGPAADWARAVAPTWHDVWVSGVWRARTTLTGGAGERPSPGELRTATLLVVVAAVWMVLCALLGAAAVA